MKTSVIRLLLTFFVLVSVFPQSADSGGTGAAGAGFAEIFFEAPPPLEPLLSTAPEIQSRAAVLIDVTTGTVLYAKNPFETIPPASLTKLMTMHLLFRAVDSGQAAFDEIVPVGRESWAQSQPPRSSLMFLAPGQIVTLKEIMLGLAVSSGNDAAVAAALRLSPSVEDFAGIMTGEARRLGMANTVFVEPSGISENNLTTAAEFTSFCRFYLASHPYSLAEFHSVREFAYPKAANVGEAFRDHPNTIVQPNRNNLLGVFPGLDGLKTGYIDEAGYNIALTAEQNGSRFLTVILGAPARPGGDRIRDRDGSALLSWAFDNFKTIRPDLPEMEPRRLWKGKEKQVTLIPADPPVFTAPQNRAARLGYTLELIEPLIAPLPAAHPAGRLVIYDESGELHSIPLVTAREYPRGNIFRRLWDGLILLFRRGEEQPALR